MNDTNISIAQTACANKRQKLQYAFSPEKLDPAGASMLHTVEYGRGDCQYSRVWENRSLWQVKVAARSDWANPRSRRPTGPRLLFNLSRRPGSGRSRWKHSPRDPASPRAASIGTSKGGRTFWPLRSPAGSNGLPRRPSQGSRLSTMRGSGSV